MSEYVTKQEIKDLGSMPAEDVDALDTAYSGIVAKLAVAVSGLFDSKLVKRYPSGFTAPYPDALKLAVAQWVTYRLWLKRGYNPAAESDQAIKDDYTDARAWLDEAANGETGLIELPKTQAAPGPGSSVTAGGPLGYSEQSPYRWTTLQRDTAREEDALG